MKNILVYTDFSYSSFNATRYAALLANSFENSKITLYHSYALNPTSEGYIPYVVDLDALKAESLDKLNDLEIAIRPFLNANTIVELLADDHLLLEAKRFCTNGMEDLAVIGSKGRSNVAQLIYGSNTVNLIKNFPYPLLVVPFNVVFEPIMQVVLACELKEVESIPLNMIKSFLVALKAKFHVLNVDPHEVEKADTNVILQQGKLHEIFDELNPEYHYTNSEEIDENIENFVKEKNIDLVIVVHKKYGFFHNIFHTSLTKKLAIHGEAPLLVLKEI